MKTPLEEEEEEKPAPFTRKVKGCGTRKFTTLKSFSPVKGLPPAKSTRN
jgi:hypothetical protein